MSRSTIITPIVGLLLCTAVPGLHAQEQPPAAIDPKACAPGDRMEFGERGLQAPGAPSQNLSDKLARTEGVLCPPPNVDPGIQAPTPNVGRTPVIPPPGSPGGDPSVRPK